MTTAFLQHPAMALHDERHHPEHAGRLAVLPDRLRSTGLEQDLVPLEPRPATERHLAAVHHWSMLEQTQMIAHEGGGWHDADTYVTPHSWQSVLMASGAAITATEAVVKGSTQNAFAVCRPPGHHATTSRAMGFCLVNNVAIAAAYALEHLDVARIAIIDWDVHHGNGTQDIFYSDGRVLYCSTHNYPYYPGTGHWQEMGKGDGMGATLNVPLAPGAGETAFLQAYDELILPAVRRFQPALIMVSAGYDSHWADPLGAMNVSTTAYATVADRVYNLAQEVCGGRLVCALEGGYHPQALADCIVATLQVLIGQPDRVRDPMGSQPEQPVSIGHIISGLHQHHPLLQ